MPLICTENVQEQKHLHSISHTDLITDISSECTIARMDKQKGKPNSIFRSLVIRYREWINEWVNWTKLMEWTQELPTYFFGNTYFSWGAVILYSSRKEGRGGEDRGGEGKARERWGEERKSPRNLRTPGRNSEVSKVRRVPFRETTALGKCPRGGIPGKKGKYLHIRKGQVQRDQPSTEAGSCLP